MCWDGYVRNSKRLRSKTWLLAAVAVLSNVLGNFALSRGMRDLGMASFSVNSLMGALLNPWVACGICLLAIWLVSQLSLLSWADLSYVIPLTASSYVLTALVGAVVLREYVSTAHWIGIGLIFLGVMLVGKTAPQTVPVRSAERGK
jgi:drug/metabolite transporter (DMT)-like permease